MDRRRERLVVTGAWFNGLIHQPTRLSLLALLVVADYAEFSYLAGQLELSGAALSEQVAILAGHGYVDTVTLNGRRGPTTTVRLTASGRGAFERHLAALRQFAALGGPSAGVA